MRIMQAPTANAVMETGGVQLGCKIINIGDWNMNLFATVTVAHGLNASSIRHCSAVVRNDADTLWSPLNQSAEPTFAQYDGDVLPWDGTNIYLGRAAGSYFRTVNYDSTAYNRGWIYIWYTL